VSDHKNLVRPHGGTRGEEKRGSMMEAQRSFNVNVLHACAWRDPESDQACKHRRLAFGSASGNDGKRLM